MECGICYNEFKCCQSDDACPMLAGCGHSFCKKCCMKLNGKRCPFKCDVVIKIPNLVPNYSLLSVLELAVNSGLLASKVGSTNHNDFVNGVLRIIKVTMKANKDLMRIGNAIICVLASVDTIEEESMTSCILSLAESVSKELQFKIGKCCGEISGNAAESVRYYKLSAAQGHADAQCALGVCYANGDGVDKDEVEAVRYYILSAAQGHAGALYNLGACYENGNGVEKDEMKYYKLFAKEAETSTSSK